MEGHENVVRQLLGTNRIELGGRNYRNPHHIPKGWDIAWNNSSLKGRTADIFKTDLGRMRLPVTAQIVFHNYADTQSSGFARCEILSGEAVMQYLSGGIIKDFTQFTFQ